MTKPQPDLRVFPVVFLPQHQALLLLKQLNGFFLTKAEEAEMVLVKAKLLTQTKQPE